MLIADADVPDQVIQALQAVRFEIIRAKELGIPIDDDRPLMEGVRERNGVLTTKDTGIPSQAYLYQYAQNGLTVVVLRWKKSRPKDWQEMVLAILRDAELWHQIAAKTPSVISVTRTGSRPRAWRDIPATIAEAAKGRVNG